jgi:CMP-N-acetylneuraminic acid synthetase
MRILGLIPARGGSKGVHRKNLQPIAGKPLITYSIISALRSQGIDTLIVSTDDQEIAEIARSEGAEVPFIRPEELAMDTSPTVLTVLHAIKYLEEQQQFYDGVCLLQPTVPFRSHLDIDQAINRWKSSDADSLVSIRPVPHPFHPDWVFYKDEENQIYLANGQQEIIPRRQELTPAYYRDGAIYLTRTQIILKNHSLYGKRIMGYQMEKSPDINIDTWEDFERAKEFATKNLSE